MAITTARRIISNAASMLTNDVLNKATNFVLYLLVARYLGSFAFGQMSLALTFYYTFQVLAVVGLQTLVTREVARDRTKTDQYLFNGSIVVLGSSLLSMIILLLFVRLMNYGSGTASIILLLSVGLVPYSLSIICQAVFQAWERMHYIAYANVPVNIAKVILAFLMLFHGYELYHLILLLVASRVIIAGAEWWLMIKHITRPRMKIDLRFSLTMIRAAVTFLGIDWMVAMWASLNIVLLSKLASETEVGLYNAATQLMVPVMLFFQSMVVSIFPIMCRKFDAGFSGLKRISENLIEFLLAIALPAAIGLFFLADRVLLLLYGKEEFLLASGAVRIMVWNLILIAVTQGLGHVLLAGLREKMTLRIVVVDTVVSLGLGLILISQFGLIGAAVTALLARIVDFLQHYVPVSRLLSKIALGRLTWKPVVASTCMAVYLAVVVNQGVLLTVLCAGVVYAGVLLALTVWSIGGPSQVKDRYLYLLSE